MPNEKLKIALAVQSYLPGSAAAFLITEFQNDPRYVTVATEIITEPALKRRSTRVRMLLLIRAFEKKIFGRREEILPGGGGAGVSSREAALRFKALSPDYIVRLGGGDIGAQELASSAQQGLLSLNFSNTEDESYLIAGYTEVAAQCDVSGFNLSWLSPQGTDKRVVLSGNFQTQFNFYQNNLQLLKKTGAHVRNFLARTKRVDISESSLTVGRAEIVKPVAAPSLIKYILSTGIIVFKKVLRRLSGNAFNWRVALYQTDLKNLFESEALLLLNPQGRLLADPFVFEHEQKTYCFMEDFDDRTFKGRISVHQIGESLSSVRPCLIEEFHLSFPFVFRYSGDIYMCPETSEAREIRVYRSVQFPLRWELHAVLMKNISAVDTLLFERDGRWWMFTNIDSTGQGDNSSELHLFYSDSPLSDQWKPHAQNPVLINSACARNGGFYRDGMDIYRVCQRQAFNKYGAASAVMKITGLSETVYKEETVREINPDFLPGLSGTHHLSGSTHYIAVDFF